MRRLVSLCALMALSHASALAQDDEGGGGLLGDGPDIDLTTGIDIDLGGEVDTVRYEGSHTQTSGQLKPGARISITHSGGNLSVRCTDADRLNARLDFFVDATTENDAKRFGDAFRLSAWGENTSAGAKVSMGSKPAAVKNYEANMVVSVPDNVNLTISASRGWVEAIGCNGSVTATAGDGGAFVSGQLKGFKVSATAGDVRVYLKPDAGLSEPSAITASKGKAHLVLPHSESARLDARGSSVRVDMAVTGSTGPTSVTGTVGEGKPQVTIRASGEVKITPTE